MRGVVTNTECPYCSIEERTIFKYLNGPFRMVRFDCQTEFRRLKLLKSIIGFFFNVNLVFRNEILLLVFERSYKSSKGE